MKKLLFILAVVVPIGVFAATATYQTKSNDTLQTVADKNGMTVAEVAMLNPNTKLVSRQQLVVTVVETPTSTPTTTGEIIFNAYTTGYGYPDNTPAGNAISNPVIHQGAGGTGTFADPVTIAVGHSITNRIDTPDFPAGTRFYIPNLRRYFIVEDTCGDGNTPQNGPCHRGYPSPATAWLDLWVGGSQASKKATLACEDAITDVHVVIENPAPDYAVLSGPIYNGTCSQQFGEALILQ